ncbi:hypothetical protein M076_4647 [Bacteroides fragilis str. 2-F-2 |nr:hypothetical protein M077_5252 [Bacteroides fragilis str. 2-F-2 \
MQALLNDIELDIQELKYLMEIISREPDSVLRGVARRNIVQMRGRLDALLELLDAKPVIAADASESPENRPVTETIEVVEIPALKETVADIPEENEEAAVAEDSQETVEPEPLHLSEAVIEQVPTVKLDPVADEKEEVFESVSVPQPEEPTVKVETRVASSPILAERIKTAGDLRRSISLNDSFRFSRELFGGSMEQMNNVLHQIGEMSSLDAALVFLSSKIKVDEENEAMNDFVELLRKHFI